MTDSILSRGGRFAAYGMLATSILAILYQLAVMIGVIDYVNIWGGKIQSQSQMYILVSVSIAVNVCIV